MKLIIVIALWTLKCFSVWGLHYRGSMMTWRIINETSSSVRVEILQRHSWNITVFPCNATQIASGNHMIGGGALNCVSPCPLASTTIGSIAAPCTGFNNAETYVTTEGRLYFNAPKNVTFRSIFNNSAWFTLVTGGGSWAVTTRISTFKRPSGRYNQAPIVTMLPVILLRRFLTYKIKINVADNDFDRYKCFWSNSTNECGGICRSALSLPASTYLDESNCILHFRPVTVGYYAMAFSVVDYEDDGATIPLSRVPIQFIFRVWTTNHNCSLPPLYLGDVAADECIFIEPGQSITVIIRIRIQCPNASLSNIIAIYPTGFTQSSPFLDPYDSTINTIRVNYTALSTQVGQNLFCFAGVDSIGNQGDSTCLRFTVQTQSDSQNTLYLKNATHSPTGLVSRSQSTWTLIYPSGLTFTRPNATAFVRFKRRSNDDDFATYNVATQSANVEYLADRLVIKSNVIFNSNEQYYISLDPGVFLPVTTCLRDSMGIFDPNFWPFETPWEPSTSTTTTTTQETTTTTIRNRTVPTLRTLVTTTKIFTTLRSTSSFSTQELSISTRRITTTTASFPVGGSIGISIGVVFLIALIIGLVIFCRPPKPSQEWTNFDETQSCADTTDEQFYRVVTRRAYQPTTMVDQADSRPFSAFNSSTEKNLVLIDI